MKITDDHGRELDATFAVTPTPTGADVIVESRGGADAGPTKARNSDYAPGLELLLKRLARDGAVLREALVDSSVARRLPPEARRLLSVADFPMALSAMTDILALRHRLGRASAAFGRPSGSSGGNPTKRLKLVLEWPGAVGLGAADLERLLAGDAAARAPVADTAWSETELRACVEAYHRLWQAQADARPRNKAALRREVLARSLPGRSEGAYEFRMQNISAVLEDLGIERVEGYLPRRNVGAQKPVIVRLINEAWNRQSEPEAPTADPDALDTRVASARSKLKRGADGRLPPPPPGSPPPPKAPVVTSRFPRDPEVVAWVLEAADGVCEVCNEPAPFVRANGEPYLEVHHVRHLADGGPDKTDNAVAGCPNCHRRLHHGGDRETARRALLAKVPRLRAYPRAAVPGAPEDV